MQIPQHALAALLLITTGADHLSHPHTGTPVLAICEIAAGILLIGSVIRERLRRAEHGGVESALAGGGNRRISLRDVVDRAAMAWSRERCAAAGSRS